MDLPPIPTSLPAGVSGRGVSPDTLPNAAKPRLARGFELAAWGIGVVLVLVWAGFRVHSATASRGDVRQFERARAERAAPAASREFVRSVDTGLWSPERVDAFVALAGSPEQPLGVLRIPRIGLEAPVFDGTEDAVLDRGVGRIEGTARLEEGGNVGIAGHRDGFFRGLKDLECGDRIEIATLARNASYRVDEIRIVSPENVEVLDPTPEASLTLVTCYPFYYVGSAPRRYIVRAVRESPSEPTSSR